MAELRERVAHVQEVRAGFRRGYAELAADGEPRPEYSPGVPLLARYATKAAEIGVGVSTLRRWVKDFGERGPAGLADDRWRRRQQPLAGADPRWLEMARRVLAEHTEASKPTRDLILAEVAARLAAGQPGLPYAARQLGIRNAILTSQLRQLEVIVGTALLRTGPDGRLTLTAYGERFARDVRPALESLAQSRNQSTSHAP
jgi:transposase-like protein